MPYRWTTEPSDQTQELLLWPHESLPPRGFAGFIGVTFVLILLPGIPLLGTPILWGLLPFLLLAVWGIYFALRRNHRARQITEVLTLGPETTRLWRRNPDGGIQEWSCNPYWCRVTKYDTEGPVPHYITLKGQNREVEIGAFLSEEERITLYDDLNRALRDAA